VTVTAPTERELCAALRRRHESAFAALVDEYSPPLRRLALTYVRSAAVADEVVQETWLAVVRGIDRFEGRSSLKTWIYQILTNIAKTRGERESRTVPLSSLAVDGDEHAVDPARFLDESHERWPGHWAAPPSRWDELPESWLLGRETMDVLRDAVDALPPAQRQVILLRDVDGWPADEVCELLELTEVNQRVLLHRARSKVRAALESHLADD
jgi:RNA polymerase sigma-70 factor (ECF subfamily)